MSCIASPIRLGFEGPCVDLVAVMVSTMVAVDGSNPSTGVPRLSKNALSQNLRRALNVDRPVLSCGGKRFLEIEVPLSIDRCSSSRSSSPTGGLFPVTQDKPLHAETVRVLIHEYLILFHRVLGVGGHRPGQQLIAFLGMHPSWVA